SLKTEMQGQAEVRYLQGAARLPAGLQPAFALKDGYLVVGTSPEAIRRFARTAAVPPDGPVPMLRVSLNDIRQFVQTHRKELTAALAEQNNAKLEDIDRQLDGLVLGLRLIDRVEISQRDHDGQAAMTLRVQTALPLRK